MIDNCRVKAIQRMLKAYSPLTVEVNFVIRELAFDSYDEGFGFLSNAGLVFVKESITTATDGTIQEITSIDPKKSVFDISRVFNKDNLLM
jgi:hypothetical protein